MDFSNMHQALLCLLFRFQGSSKCCVMRDCGVWMRNVAQSLRHLSTRLPVADPVWRDLEDLTLWEGRGVSVTPGCESPRPCLLPVHSPTSCFWMRTVSLFPSQATVPTAARLLQQDGPFSCDAMSPNKLFLGLQDWQQILLNPRALLLAPTWSFYCLPRILGYNNLDNFKALVPLTFSKIWSFDLFHVD